MKTEFNEEESAAIEELRAWREKNRAEIDDVNNRLKRLRWEFQKAFNDKNIEEIFVAVDSRTDYMAWDTPEYQAVSEIAGSLGLGFSDEEYYIWTPSTRQC